MSRPIPYSDVIIDPMNDLQKGFAGSDIRAPDSDQVTRPTVEHLRSYNGKSADIQAGVAVDPTLTQRRPRGQHFHRSHEQFLEERKHAGRVSTCNILGDSKSMLTLFPMLTLMMDAARVIEIRLRMMALGTSTPNEMALMVTEKMKAMEEAATILMLGGNPSHVIDNYQKIVAANVARLSDV
jgi:hypothetical protein